MRRYDDYDRFAEVYSRHWGGFSGRCLPVLEKLLLPYLPEGARVLDLCCGAGHLAALLSSRGYRVTGIDGSDRMIRRARANAPEAEFLIADARSFAPSAESFSGAVCLFDSLNHMMSPDDLIAVFRSVRATLRPAGRFLFDLNMEDGFIARWNDSLSIVEEEYVCVVRARYDARARVGRNDITLFERGRTLRGWRRADLTLTQRCYTEDEVREALAGAGLTGVRTFEATRDLGADMGVGRMFFSCKAG